MCVICVAADVEKQMGTANDGVVHGLYDYTAHNSDELSFCTGDKLLILRKGDDAEEDWWWASLHHSEGYIPTNYIGVCNNATKLKFNTTTHIVVVLLLLVVVQSINQNEICIRLLQIVDGGA